MHRLGFHRRRRLQSSHLLVVDAPLQNRTPQNPNRVGGCVWQDCDIFRGCSCCCCCFRRTPNVSTSPRAIRILTHAIWPMSTPRIASRYASVEYRCANNLPAVQIVPFVGLGQVFFVLHMVGYIMDTNPFSDALESKHARAVENNTCSIYTFCFHTHAYCIYRPIGGNIETECMESTAVWDFSFTEHTVFVSRFSFTQMT